MYISVSKCNPHVCKYECRDACARIHGDDSPLGFGKESLHPVIDEETCDKCLACIRSCPLDAISLTGTQDEIPEPVPPPVSYPYNQRDDQRHRTFERLIQNIPWLSRFIMKSDKISEREKEKTSDKF